MSRIEELELRIKHLHVGKETIETSLATQQEIIREAEKELAALKAESDRPREWLLGIDAHGMIVGVSDSGAGAVMPIKDNSAFPIKFLTLVEKKPIVVTHAMAEKFQSAWRWSGNDLPTQNQRVMAATIEALKAIGIEARCGDE